jgi:hypothetical protein
MDYLTSYYRLVQCPWIRTDYHRKVAREGKLPLQERPFSLRERLVSSPAGHSFAERDCVQSGDCWIISLPRNAIGITCYFQF